MTRLCILIAASIAALAGGQSLFTDPPTVAPDNGGAATPLPTILSTNAPTTNPPTTNPPTTNPPTTNPPTTNPPTTNLPTTNPPTTALPASTAVPSAAPTLATSDMISSSPTAPFENDDNVVASPVDGSCDGLCSDSYSSIGKIQLAVSMVNGAGTICLCPMTFAPEAGNCLAHDNQNSNETSSKPSILVQNNQDVTIECVSPLGAKCIFACPSTVVQVASGGSVTFIGGNNTLFTGGTLYSRVQVDAGASAMISGVEFSNTAAGASRRRSLAEDITASGMGGGIINMGSLTVETSSFNNCSASMFGGAIYTDGNAQVTTSSFTNNFAPTGGAIYASGQFELENNAFSGNAASESGANLAGDANLAGCGNAGLSGTTSCESSAQAMAIFSAASVMVGVLTAAAVVVL
ncbi:hypothetical protein MPSEU_000758900 [Mayamaea pseudoterrestris]|nr:hypothetical protein MPSEU_000758900 [Mayamaea pseudoterrestris]